ncbi:MAG: protein kinase [Terriglobales bacterium]|jgi:serine/threonine-protein kinase
MEDRGRERFGRYEILAELGRGAMGVVYKARDPRINRVVAVKTVSLVGLAPEDEREYRERFAREAEAAGRLSHPGIVTIFDVGEEPESHSPYIVMEFVGGQSLDKLLSDSEHKLPVETALQLTLELAEALDCAHGQGVVHRDLKPANILLTEDGHAKIADFGIAKLNLANQTLAGRALGTPAYMSPEQLNGEAVDGRSDLFSLGVVLYTMVTGHRPFQGNSAVTVSFKVVNRDPLAATLLNAELPKGLDFIIDRAIAKEPALRYQRGLEMVLDIQHMQQGREPWSKAKDQEFRPIVKEILDQKKRTRSSIVSTPSAVAAKVQSRVHSLHFAHDATRSLLMKIRKRALVGAVLLVGFLLGIRIIATRHHPVSPQADHRSTTPTTTATKRMTAAEAIAAAEAMPTNDPVITVQPATPVAPAATPRITTTPAPSSTHPKVVASAAKAAIPADKSAKVERVSSPAVSTATPPAMLELEVDHKFAEGQLSIWVDDQLTYQRRLEGTDKKRLVVFHHVEGHELHAMQVSAGKHSIRVQVTSEAANYDQSATVAGDFASRGENVLRINCNKPEINLSLQ